MDKSSGVPPNNTSWSQICNFFETFPTIKGTTKQRKAKLQDLIKKSLPLQQQLYPLVRVLCPPLDNCTFYLKREGLGKLLAKALVLADHTEDAKALTTKRRGDFATVAFNVLSKRQGSDVSFLENKKSVSDVDEFLTQLASVQRGKGVENRQAELLRKHLMDYSAREWKWIIRVILKEVNAGISEGLTLAAMHTDARQMYMIHNKDIKTVCEMLQEGDPVAGAAIPKLMVAFAPQLAERPVSLGRIADALNGKKFYIEDKMDGERLQLHKDGDQYKLYSRKATDYTDLYGSVIDNIRQKKLILPDKCILDGEIVGYNAVEKRWIEFGTLKSIARACIGESHLCFVVFDIVQAGDQSLVDMPLSERWHRMHEVLVFDETRFVPVGHEETSSLDRIVERIYQLGQGEEGLVLKDPGAKYKPGGREGAGWFKLKPEDLCGGVDSFDCLIVGMSRGHFVVAVADNLKSSETEPTIFRTLCKVRNGLSKADCAALCQRLKKHSRPFDQSKAELLTDRTRNADRRWGYVVRWPGGIEVHFSEDKGANMDLVYHPKFSEIVEIVADRRMVCSTKVMAGLPYPGCPAAVPIPEKGEGIHCSWALRFPRIGPRGIREKAWTECMTQDELWKAIDKCKKASLDVNHPHTFEEQNALMTTIQKRNKRKLEKQAATRIQKKPVSSWGVLGQVRCDAEQRWSTLSHCVVCVLDNADGKQERDAVIGMAKEMGARIAMVAEHRDTTHIISFGEDNQRFITIRDHLKKADVIRASWIHDCHRLAQSTDGEAGFIPLQPRYMMHMTQQTEAEFRSKFDWFGDSYMECASAMEMHELLLERGDKEEAAITDEEMLKLEAEMMDDNDDEEQVSTLLWSMFGGCRMLMVDVFGKDDVLHVSRLGMASACLIAGGGEEVSTIDKTHVVVDRGNKSSAQVLEILKKKHVCLHDSSVKVVDASWVTDSFKAGKLLPLLGDSSSKYLISA